MADAILGSVIQVAQIIYAIVQGNLAVREEEKELGELCGLISSSLAGVDGEQASNFKDPLSSMLHYLEEARGIMEHLQKRKGLQKALEVLNPQAMLDKLAACQAKIFKVNQILGVAFSADAAKKQQEAAKEEFDACAVINHISAKTFWRKQFGSKEYEVKWARLKGAFQREYKNDLPGLLTNENFEILKSKLDPNGENTTTVYAFADYTDDYGLLKSFLRSVKPESTLEKLPESKGPASEILKRTIFIENALVFDITDVGPISIALEESAGSTILKSIKFENGVLVEFLAIEHITQVLELDLTKKKKLERKLQVKWAKATVDEVWQKSFEAEEEKKRRLEDGKAGVKPEEAQAAVSMELKLLQEEQAQKVEEHQNEHREKMAAVEKEAQAAAMKRMGGDSKDAKMTPEQQAALEAEVKAEVEKKKAALLQEYSTEEKRLADEKEKETKKLKSRYANLKFLTDIFAPSKEKIQDDFMSYFQDNKEETVIEFYQCSLNGRAFFGDIPRVGHMYITEFGLYFYSSVFGSEQREILKFSEMTVMEKRKYLGFPTALGFVIFYDNDPDDKRDLEFVTFTDRNATFTKIEEVWDGFVKKNSGVLVAAGDRVTYEKTFVVKKEGKLQKKGAVIQNWKERWFVLSENTFTYAKKKGDPIIRAIPLNKVGDCRIDEKNRKQFLFHVITKERTFECKAKTAKDMEDWVDKIKECLSALRLSFYYGVIVQQTKSVYQPQWRVLELNFTMKCVRLMNQSRVVVQVPFEQVHRTDRDHENPMVFYIFMKSGARYVYICQTGEDREAIVDILERITKKGNKMVEELLRLRKQMFLKDKEKSIASAAESAKSPKNGADAKSPKSEADAKRLDDAQKTIASLERSLHAEAGNVIDDLRQQQAVVIRRGALSVVGSFINDKRYCILENRDEGARMTIYQSDISVIPLDIIALKSCTLLQDDEYRFAIFSSMTEKPWHFQAETPAIRAEWMTSLLFSMYPLPVGQSALAIDVGPGGNTTGGIGLVGSASPPPLQTSGTMALLGASSPTAAATPAGGARARGYTGVGQPPPYAAAVGGGGSGRPTMYADNEKEGYPNNLSKRASMGGGGVTISAAGLMAGAAVGNGAFQDLANENNVLKSKLAEALKKMESAVKDRDAAVTESRDGDRKLLLLKDSFDIENIKFFSLFLRQGAMFTKHQKGASPNPRYVFLAEHGATILWAENNTLKQKQKAKELKVSGIKEIRKGISNEAFVKPKYITDAQAKLCFSIIGAERSLDFQTDSEEQRDFWCEALAKVISKTNKKVVSITTGPPAGGDKASPGSPSVSAAGSGGSEGSKSPN